MIIAISGSVGVGKTELGKYVSEYFSCEYLELNSYAEKYKINEVPSIQTFDFDIDRLLKDLESDIANKKKDNHSLVVESHFAHLINPKLVDILVIVNRDLEELKREYKKREYNSQKIKENLEVESFDLCFFEAEEEGYEPEQFIKIENDEDIEDLQRRVVKKISNKLKK